MGTKHAELLEEVQREKDEITVAVIVICPRFNGQFKQLF